MLMKSTPGRKLFNIPFTLNDASIPIPPDGHDGHGGHEEWKNFAGRDTSAQPNGVGAEGPLPQKELPQGDRHGKKTEEEVGEGQGHDEVVVRRSHRGLPQNCNLLKKLNHYYFTFFECCKNATSCHLLSLFAMLLEKVNIPGERRQ